MIEVRFPDATYEDLLDALAEAARKPCPTGADINRDALMIALAQFSIFPASILPYDDQALEDDLDAVFGRAA